MCDEKPFDELVELFRSNPDEFEKYRTKFLEDHIASLCADCPEKLERCKRIQWRIEQELNKYKNPIARYNAMVVIFWKQFDEFQRAVNAETTTPTTKQDANILQFPKKK